MFATAAFYIPWMRAPLPKPLLGVVDAIWRYHGFGAPSRILPDGCMDFVFDLNTGGADVVGSMTRAELIAPAAGARYFGVRFLPGAAALVLDARASELTNQSLELAPLLPRGWRTLPEQVASAAGDEARILVLERFLTDSAARRRADAERLDAATRALRLSCGSVRVRALAEQLKVSERQLERWFDERVGVGPKLFARVMRLQRACTLLREGRAESQAALALEAGYSDESHLLRDFRELAAATPSEVRAESFAASGIVD